MHISRGYGSRTEAAPQSVDYHLVHDRLSLLERLTALRAAGTLGEAEFLAEKERILALPGEELVLRPEQPWPERKRAPSLLGRLLNWKIVVAGALLGLALGFFSRPDDAVGILGRFAL